MKIILLVGIVASGKTTYINQHFFGKEDFVIISPDEIRQELTGNMSDQSKNAEVFQVAGERAEFALKSGKNVVIDATNYNIQNRKKWIQIGKFYGAEIEAVILPVSLEVAKERNSKRNRVVPEWVIEKQYTGFQYPNKNEGIDTLFLHSIDK